ncbi:DNA replication protein RecF [Cycloclasticus sp. 46_120_T64]|nr:DNA replication protein RecF [Cycloclasticus sp. 46_120_T64]
MYLSKIQINNVRNIAVIGMNPCEKLNVIVGPNGSGKTSVLESLYLLSRARSFRTHNIKKVVSFQQDNLTVFAELQGDNRQHKIAINKSQSDTVIRINGQTEKKSSELSRYLHSHLIRPESQTLLENGSSVRRSFIDWGVFHQKHDFLDISKKHNQLLKQRNKLLKTKQLDTLSVWNNKFVEYGTMVCIDRQAYVSRFEQELYLIARQLLGDVDVKVEFIKGWDKSLSLEEALNKAEARDTYCGHSTVGSHKSDIKVLVNDKLAQDFLSRGQMKLMVIAMYLAQIKLMSGVVEKSACVLIDDLAAELDQYSFHKVMIFLEKLSVQVFITTTNKQLFLEYIEANKSKVFHVKHGRIETEEH